MHQFKAIKEDGLISSSKIAELQLFSSHNEIQIKGILRKLFGESFYETSNYDLGRIN